MKKKRLFSFIIDIIISFPLSFIFGSLKVPIFGLIMCFLYYTLFIISPIQGTIGQRLMGLKVTNFDNSNSISFNQSILRFFTGLKMVLTLGYSNKINWDSSLWINDVSSKSKTIII